MGKPVCPGLEHTFRTYAPEASGADSRRYELVSPGEKNSAEVGGLAQRRRLRGIALDPGLRRRPLGRSCHLHLLDLLRAGAGAFAASQYLAKRTPGGWSTENISPFGFHANLFVPPYLGFSPGPALRGVQNDTSPVDAGLPADVENMYLHESEGGATRCLTPEAPPPRTKRPACSTGARAKAGAGSSWRASPKAVEAPTPTSTK